MRPEPALWKALLEARCPDLRLKPDAAGAQLTTFAIGGTVALLAEPLSPSAAIQLLSVLGEEHISWRILGYGSNIIIPDTGIDEVVLRLGREFSGCVFREPVASSESALATQWERSGTGISDEESLTSATGDSVTVTAFGSAPMMGLSRKLSNAGLSGLEFAAGIPGSIGGGLRMNAGAHGHSLSEIVTAALVIEVGGNIRRLEQRELGFSYRRSLITPEMLVLAVEISLIRKDRHEIMEHRSKCLEYRRATQPLHLPSAGSAFKNPSPLDAHGARMPLEELPAAAKLLEQAGFKGCCHGGVSFSEQHSNWLVKIADSAKAEDVHFLLNAAQAKVRELYAVDLTPEIILW